MESRTDCEDIEADQRCVARRGVISQRLDLQRAEPGGVPHQPRGYTYLLPLLQDSQNQDQTMPTNGCAISCQKSPEVDDPDLTDEEAPQENIKGEGYPRTLPKWARERLQEIKVSAPKFFAESSADYGQELARFSTKEEVQTAMTLGCEKLLQWLKQYAAIVTLEENISVRDFMTSWLGNELNEYKSKRMTVTEEEKEQLMELIIRQSELLMIYDLFLKNGCSALKQRKVMERRKLPEVEGSVVKKKGLQHKYELPIWAREELAKVMKEKVFTTNDEESPAFLLPLLSLPRHLRKEETERRLERGKKQIMKYLSLMQTLRSMDVLLPTSDTPHERSSEEMKSIILNMRTGNVKKQFLNLFPDLGPDILDGGAQTTGADDQQNINEALLKLEEQKRLEEKADLQENIIKMDKKMQAYEEYLKCTNEVVYTKETYKLPEFKIPKGLTDIDPEHYTIVEGRPFIQKFNKTEYIESLRRIFLTNLTNSLAEDKEAMAEQQNLVHIEYLIKVLDEIDYYTEAFTIYLIENQDEMMINTRSFLDIGKLLMAKEAEVIESNKISNIIKASLYSLGGLLKFRRLCQSILFELSPTPWREKYKEEKQKLRDEAEHTADQILIQLALYKSNTLVEQKRLDQLIIFLADTVRNLGPPANYFSNGLQIDLAVRQLELSNLQAFQHLALIIKKREEQERAKCELIRNCECEIERIEAVVERMRNQFLHKVQQIKILDDRSQNILDKYWKIVTVNEPLAEAITLIKEMFDDFIGLRVHTDGTPLDMLDILIEDIVSTQMELCELPKKATEEIRAFICEKEDMQKEVLEINKKKHDKTVGLLNVMARSWGLSVGQQGHPPRYRSCPPQAPVGRESLDKTKGVHKRMVERIQRLFGPTDQLDALEDTLQALGKVEVEETLSTFFPPGSASESSGLSIDYFN